MKTILCPGPVNVKKLLRVSWKGVAEELYREVVDLCYDSWYSIEKGEKFSHDPLSNYAARHLIKVKCAE